MNEKIYFLRRVFGNKSYLDGRGRNYYTKCPNLKCNSHLKGKLKFCILLSTTANHCWVCGIKGSNLYYIIKKYKPHFLNEYIEKFKEICDFIELDDENENEETPIELPQPFVLLGSNINSINPNTKRAISYLKKRGIDERDLWRYKVGLCDEGYTKYHNRIIFPSFDNEGNLNFFIARSTDNSFPPYFTCNGSHKGIIFNEYLINFNKEIILVEGIFDSIKAGNNSVPLLGSNLNKNFYLFNKLVENSCSVILSLDKDAESKTYKIAELLYKYDVSVKILIINDYKDIGEMPKNEFRIRLDEAIPWHPARKIEKKIALAL